MNSKALKAQMILNNDTQDTLSKALGISRSCLNSKINNRMGAEFTQGEITAIRNRYNLTNEQVVSIFFG